MYMVENKISNIIFSKCLQSQIFLCKSSENPKPYTAK